MNLQLAHQQTQHSEGNSELENRAEENTQTETPKEKKKKERLEMK